MKGKVNEEAKKVFVQIILHGPGKAWIDDIHFVLKKQKRNMFSIILLIIANREKFSDRKRKPTLTNL